MTRRYSRITGTGSYLPCMQLGHLNVALRRLEQLTAEVSQQPMQDVIGEAVDLIVSIERTPKGRIVRDVLHVESFSGGRYQIESYAQKDRAHVA